MSTETRRRGSNLQELSLDMLEGVSGGSWDRVTCPKAVDPSGRDCRSYHFM